MNATTTLRHSAQATFQAVADETVLIHLQTGVYYSLDEVGTVFWNLMDGARTLGECATTIAQDYGAPLETVTNDLIELATDLVKEGLAEVA